MTLQLVIHHPDHPAGSAAAAAERDALRDAAWEVADSHWAPSDEALLVSTDLSAEYLLAHFRAGLARRGHPAPGMLLILPLGATAAWSGMPPDADAWLRAAL